jgi:ABC-type transport system substrate-binding protein
MAHWRRARAGSFPGTMSSTWARTASKAPVGAGPYRFVSFTPGVELVLEANESYWRKAPSVKRLVFRSIPDATTRLAALKRGEVDLAYAIGGELGTEVQRMPGLTLRRSRSRCREGAGGPDIRQAFS